MNDEEFEDVINRFRTALERLIVFAGFYVDRKPGYELGDFFDASPGLHQLTLWAFYEADHTAFDLPYSNVRSGSIKTTSRPLPITSIEELRAEAIDSSDPDLNREMARVTSRSAMARAMYRNALDRASIRWGAFPEWFRNADGSIWRGRDYPPDFPRGDGYSVEPTELAMLKSTLDVLKLPDLDAPRAPVLPPKASTQQDAPAKPSLASTPKPAHREIFKPVSEYDQRMLQIGALHEKGQTIPQIRKAMLIAFTELDPIKNSQISNEISRFYDYSEKPRPRRDPGPRPKGK